MNYLFVVPKDNTFEFLTIPPGIVYVATQLKESGRHVFGLHLNFESDWEKALTKAIVDNRINVVCVGGLSDQYRDVKNVLELAKKINKKIVTVVGGGMVSAQPLLVMENIGADFAIAGQGERTICELADALEKGGNYYAIDGLLFLNNGIVVANKHRKDETQLDCLPFPDYAIFNYPQVPNRAISINGRIKKTVNITASRSCPYNCTFCYHPSGSTYRQRSLDNIFAEINFLLSRYEIEHFCIIDELFASNTARVFDFCQRIKPYGVTFSVQLRVDAVTDDVLRQLAYSGCVTIGYGLESADNTVLKSMKKGTTIEQIEQALSLTQQAGITPQGYFIFGDVAETKKSTQTTINWWLRHLNYGINLAMIRAFPGSALYENAVKRRLITNELAYLESGCPLINLSTLSNREFAALNRTLIYLNADFLGATLTLDVNKVHDEGGYDVSATCLHCGTVNIHDRVPFEYKNVNGAEAFCCNNCSQKMKMQPSQAISKQTYKHLLDISMERYFAQVLAGGKKVALWGVTEKAMAMLLSSKTLRDAVTIVVDRDFEIKHDKLLDRYSVEAPERLKEVSFDFLVIAAFGYEAQIRKNIDAMNLSPMVLDV